MQNRSSLYAAAQSNDLFYRHRFLIAQCNIGIERNLEAGRSLDFAKQKCFQAFGKFVSWFKKKSKNNKLHTFISQHKSRRDEKFNLKVFERLYEKHSCRPQHKKRDFRFDTNGVLIDLAGTIGCRLSQTDKLLKVSIDSQ